MTAFYDGPRAGVADFEGRPHAYASLFDESVGYSDTFLLMPIDDDLFRLALENWGIWSRWESAFRAGDTPQDTHPALPSDRLRHEELARVIGTRLDPTPELSHRARAEFRLVSVGVGLQVRWTRIEA